MDEFLQLKLKNKRITDKFLLKIHFPQSDAPPPALPAPPSHLGHVQELT